MTSESDVCVMQEWKSHSSIVLCLSPCDQPYFSGKLTCQSVPPISSFTSRQKLQLRNWPKSLAMIAICYKYGSQMITVDDYFFHSLVHLFTYIFFQLAIHYYKTNLMGRSGMKQRRIFNWKPLAYIPHVVGVNQITLCHHYIHAMYSNSPPSPPSHNSNIALYAQDVVRYSNKYMNE